MPEPLPPTISTFLFLAFAGFFGRLLMVSPSVLVRIMLFSGFSSMNGSMSLCVPHLAEPYSVLCRYFLAFFPFR